ncbi:MAG: hypothetical protein GT597_12555 [Bacteroidales bacterium]|jgi:hypothetical protein|nr:hypothetical protein [Bacteroidales bacterium]
MKTKAFVLFNLILISLPIFASDIVVLNDQKMFEGKIIKIKSCEVTFKAYNGPKVDIPVTEIFYIQFEDPNNKILTSYLAIQESDPDKCMKGQADADLYHGKGFSHVGLGVLFGPFAIIGAAVASPSPQSGSSTYMLSKNRELFSDPIYLMCYEKKAKNRNIVNAALGWASWILLVLLYAGSAE